MESAAPTAISMILPQDEEEDRSPVQVKDDSDNDDDDDQPITKTIKALPSRAAKVDDNSNDNDSDDGDAPLAMATAASKGKGKVVDPDETEDEQGEDDEDDDEEDEEESDDQVDKPRKKKRRKRNGGNQFLDIEADVDTDEDDDEEAEDGFVANDGFLNDGAERRDHPSGLKRDQQLDEYEMEGDGDQDVEVDGDGDMSHRQLDRKMNAAKNRAAEKEAADIEERYAKAKNDDDQDGEDAGPQALFMPGVDDPSIWGVRCKIGAERDLIISLSLKAAMKASADNGTELKIISAFQRDSIKGIIYVEARTEQDVRDSIDGIFGIYLRSKNGLFLIDIEEMPDLLKTRQRKIELAPGGWVRFKRGKHAGDLAQIVDTSENGEELVLKYIPRIDVTPKDEGTGADGKKRKKGVGAAILGRSPQKFFNVEEIRKVYGQKELSGRSAQGYVTFRGDDYVNGFCEKEHKMASLIVDGVQPTLAELTLFGVGRDGELGGADLSAVADAIRQAERSSLQPGDHVDVIEGDTAGIHGAIISILNNDLTIKPHANFNIDTNIVIHSKQVKKRFKEGDHVKVMSGADKDDTGLVVQVLDDTVTFLSDLSLQEITAFSKNVREAAEVGSGVNNIGQYELHDLVQLDNSTTGVIFKIEPNLFRVLDQSGTVRSLNPSQIGIKTDSKRAIAVDGDGREIRDGEMMKEGTNGRAGKVLHTYRSLFVFLHNREIVENGGVFVSLTHHITSTAPNNSKSKIKSMYGEQAAAPSEVAEVRTRRDGRIDRKVGIIRGAYKGTSGVIKDVNGTVARVELHTSSKVVSIPLAGLKEQKPNGDLVELIERIGYGGRPAFQRDGAQSSAPMYSGGRTPMVMESGGRTPFAGAPMYSGGRTPAPMMYSSGRTPMSTPVGSSSTDAWNASSGGGSTPFLGASAASGSASNNDSWNPSSRTPYTSTSTADAWNASSRTPFHPSFGGGATPADGGKTPDPRRAPGGGASSYAARSSFAGGNRVGSTPMAARGDATPMYGGYGDAGQSYSNRQPNYSYQSQQQSQYTAAPSPWFTAETPYPTAPTPHSAPTPFPTGAPTPGASHHSVATPGAVYGGAPTPYGVIPTPGGYGQTPAAYGETPAAYGATPGAYVGAATAAAQPPEYRQRDSRIQRVSNWPAVGLLVIFVASDYQAGRLVDQRGTIISTNEGTSSIRVLSNQEEADYVPTDSILPMNPTRVGERVMVLGAGNVGETLSLDGTEWLVQFPKGRQVHEASTLGLVAP